MTLGGQLVMNAMKKKAIKDMFEMQVRIRNIDKANEDDKYIYL